MINPHTTLVIGHRNPDMDAIASALGYAWLLNHVRGGGGYTPARAGEMNAQTSWALERFQAEAPQLVVDVRPRVADIVESVPALPGDPTVREASAHFARTRRAVPLLDVDGRPRGLLSAMGLFGYLVDPLLAHGDGSLGTVLEQPAMALMDGETILLRESDYLTEAVQRIRYAEPDDFLVVDAAGRYRGLCRAADMLDAPHQQLVFVDHNELGQAIAGADEAEIVEVLDHHRVDTVETVLPIRF